MSVSDRERWDAKYAGKPALDRLSPDDWLIEQVSRLTAGRALELACGLGHNAIWLDRQGWKVDAVDISPAGLARAERLASQCSARVNWIAGDLDEFVPESGAYELVLVFRFLDRQKLPEAIQGALRPGGRLIYESFTTSHLARPQTHMKNPVFALEPGELPRLFPQLDVVSYVECSLADRDVARLVAIRPPAPGKAKP